MDEEEQQLILKVLAAAFGQAQAIDIVGKYRLAATIAQQQMAAKQAVETTTTADEKTNGHVRLEHAVAS